MQYALRTLPVERRRAELKDDQSRRHERLREIVAVLKTEMQCCCDLDNWEPERSTGHSWVCRIHKEAVRRESLDRIRR